MLEDSAEEMIKEPEHRNFALEKAHFPYYRGIIEKVWVDGVDMTKAYIIISIFSVNHEER